MIRRLLMTIVFFIVLAGTAYAIPITYYFAGSMDNAFGSLEVGTSFAGSFSYDEPQLIHMYDSHDKIYRSTDFSVRIDGTTFSEDGLGPIYSSASRLRVINDASYHTTIYDVFIINMHTPSKVLGDIPLRIDGIMLYLKDDTATAFNTADLPGPDLTLDDFEIAYLALFGNYASEYAAGNLTYLSTTPVPEPATMLLLGTGLIGIARVMRKKIKRR